jgi:SAM-dependent methyltransferase
VHVCLDCGLIQVADQVPPDYFRHYVYIPSTSDAMQSHFAALAELVRSRFLTNGNGLAVDIGCNDGLFLGYLKEDGANTLGIDPATNIAELANARGVEVVNEYFTPDLAEQVRSEHGAAALVVTTNTFHHIGDLDSFTEGVRRLLAADGVFIVEVPHALELVELNQFDGVYHEHVSQHTVKSFVDLLGRYGLEVFEVEPLPVHGGSIRVFARPAANGRSLPPAVREWVEREREHGLFSAATYDAFRERVERNKESLLGLLSEVKSRGERIVGYGASARGNTLLNYFGIGGDYLDFLVDRNPLKHDLYSPGMHLRVLPVERLLEEMPDYVLLVAWNFADEIVRQQDEYRRRGGRFIQPIPEPQLVQAP